MVIYKFVVETERELFMVPSTRRDTSEYFIAAYSYDQARDYVMSMLKHAGWQIIGLEGKEVFLQDIRDVCDQITS